MAVVFRIEKRQGYTIMSNHHLRNKELTLKAKGLLSQMLSLPEDWDYPFTVCGQIVLLSNPILAAALPLLSEHEQEVIFLYFFQRETQKEIGKRYGRTRSTTGRQIQLALQHLRKEMEVLSHEPASPL